MTLFATLWNAADAGNGSDILGPLLRASLTTLLVWGVAMGLFAAGYYFFSLPLRRREQERLFLDLLASGLQRGQGIEPTIMGLAASGDRSLGKGLARLANRLASGVRFEQAIVGRPAFLPPETAALLRAGYEAGDVASVLAARQEATRDGVTEVWKAQHYLVLLAFVVTPAWMVAFTGFCVFVLPKLQQIMFDLGAAPPVLLLWLAANLRLLVVGQLLVLAAGWFLAALYLGGPRFRDRLTQWAPRLVAGLAFRLPWRRRRMQRDFSATLAVLLDAGLAEPRAVQLAAATAGNERFTVQASQVIDDLRGGVALPAALERLDKTGELRWRLANAVHGRGGFRRALAGWHEALEAQAFHDEQVVAQIVTTALVLFNGLLVAVLAFGLFQLFTHLIDAGVLW